MTKNSLSFSQRVSISKALDNVVEPLEGGYCRYKDGWSDEKVSETMPFPCTVTNVGSIRREMFGNIKSTTTKGDTKAKLEKLAVTVDEIEQAIQALNLRLAHVEKRLI